MEIERSLYSIGSYWRLEFQSKLEMIYLNPCCSLQRFCCYCGGFSGKARTFILVSFRLYVRERSFKKFSADGQCIPSERLLKSSKMLGKSFLLTAGYPQANSEPAKVNISHARQQRSSNKMQENHFRNACMSFPCGSA